jgi:peptide-methionine (S)-S-oxide reductase
MKTLSRWALLLILPAALLLWKLPATAESAVAAPPPAADEKPDSGGLETAVLAGGCFWGVQGVYEHVNGVTKAVAGYSGGEANTAEYETVSTGSTGHAESVEITYDPKVVTYGQLLQIYFSVVADPTELNYQGPDHGTQYRTAFFVETPEQKAIAAKYIDQLKTAGFYKEPIVTTLEPFKAFYPAEGYHQDFLNGHPHYPYIAINDMPKVENLKHLFPSMYREQPVLVGSG